MDIKLAYAAILVRDFEKMKSRNAMIKLGKANADHVSASTGQKNVQSFDQSARGVLTTQFQPEKSGGEGVVDVGLGLLAADAQSSERRTPFAYDAANIRRTKAMFEVCGGREPLDL